MTTLRDYEVPKNLTGSKHLRSGKMIEKIIESFNEAEDYRADNSTIENRDVLLCGLACMYLQSTSLGNFQEKIQTEYSVDNLTENYPFFSKHV